MTIVKFFCKAALLLFLMTSGETTAQVAAARTAMQNLYTLYDSVPYITFDVRYTYSTDTLFNDYQKEVIKGTYTMNGHLAKFTVADVEYMQNDSLFITTYHKDKMIMVTKARQMVAGQYMPLRSAIDSLLNAYDQHYNISVEDNEGDTSGFIKFTRSDSLAAFENFNIYFDKIHNSISTLEYVFFETDLPEEESIYSSRQRKKTLRIDFINYRFDNFSNSVYDTNNYVWNDEGELKSVAKLQGYKVYDAR